MRRMRHRLAAAEIGSVVGVKCVVAIAAVAHLDSISLPAPPSNSFNPIPPLRPYIS